MIIMLKDKNITIVTNPVEVNHSSYIFIPKKKCIISKNKTYIFKINISEVDL